MSITKEVQTNHEAYRAIQAEMEAEHFGKYVLIHKGKVEGI